VVLATNSSARSPRLRGFIVGAVSLYVAIEGVSLFIVRVAAGGAWAAWIAFFAASTAIAGITVLLYAPRLRRVDDLTGGARRLSAGDFGARVEVSDDEFAGLASALNTAADSFGRIVGVPEALVSVQVGLVEFFMILSLYVICNIRDLHPKVAREFQDGYFGIYEVHAYKADDIRKPVKVTIGARVCPNDKNVQDRRRAA